MRRRARSPARRERRARRRPASPPCAPMPGSRNGDCGMQPPRLGDLAPGTSRRRRRRSTTGRTRRRAPRPSSRTSPATCCQSRRPSASSTSCTSALPAFDVLTRQNKPAPSRRQASRNGASESRPEIRIDGDRVGERDERRRRTRCAVEPMSPRFASAITSSPAARAYAHTSLERADAVGAERLEERRLRLDRDGVRRRPRRRCRSRTRATSPPTSSGSRSTTGSSPTTSWLCLPLDRVGEPVGEVRHRHRRHPRRNVLPARGARDGRAAQPLLTADFSALPAENFGTRAAGMCDLLASGCAD